MSKPPRPWIVAPHDPIQRLEDNLWAVDGDVPGMKFRRRMIIARRDDGKLVFYNAVPLRDDAMAELQAFGAPAILIVPNSYHKLDAHPFRARLGVALHCASAIAERVRKTVPVDGVVEDLPADGAVTISLIAGTKIGEVAMLVRSGPRVSAVFSDVVMNVPRSTGLITTLLRTAGGPKCPPLFRLAFMRDKKAVRAALERLAEIPGLHRLIPSHGDILANDAAGVLHSIAARDL